MEKFIFLYHVTKLNAMATVLKQVFMSSEYSTLISLKVH